MPDDQPPHTGRAVVVSASVGAGHDAAADEIARRLRAEGLAVEQHDFLDLMPARTGRVVCRSYQRMLNIAPWAYRMLYGSFDRSAALSLQVSLFSRLSARRLRKAVPDGTCVVVSTYPLASQALGRMRLDRRLDAPVVTYLTDFSVHRLWVADGVDSHIAIHEIAAEQARGHHAAGLCVAQPVTNPRFVPGTAATRVAARARHGLPATGKVALLVGGSWGAGEIEAAVRDVQATGLVACAVVCGRNEELRARLSRAGVPHVFGWTDDMPGLMHAADVLVQNAGGMTVLEAAATGLPVVTYRCIPGHGVTNSAALDDAGVARWARDRDQLGTVLAQALTTPRCGAVAWCANDPVKAVLDAAVFDAADARQPMALDPSLVDIADNPVRMAFLPRQRDRRHRVGSGRRTDAPEADLIEEAA